MMLPFVVHAQLLKGAGVKIGVNSSNTRITYTRADLQDLKIGTGRRTGINIAGYAEWLTTPVFSIVTQVEYAQRGFSEEAVITLPDNPEPVATAEANSRLDYVSLPVLVKLRLPHANAGPYLILGPRMDFLVNRVAGEFDFSPYVNQLGSLVKESATSGWVDFFADRYLGGTAGVGFASARLAGMLVQLEMRYNFDVADNAEIDLFEAKNRALDLWLGVQF
ncbi:outer membrane beta-barrel protein [candidate division KSB1 bacterium]|nr:outer membrane beta-barrel protein [candidate division KSB1 bacterium]